MILKFRSGIKYKINVGKGDRNIINEVWIHRIYTPPNFEINPSDIIIDIGAQIGGFTVFASTKAPKGVVYSFEPMSKSFKLLSENLALNDITNVVAINKAVSDKPGTASIYSSKTNNGGHSLNKGLVSNIAEEIVVQTTSLEEIWKMFSLEYVDFMKIDCEGSEYNLLMNTSDLILNNIKKISMEYHDIDNQHTGDILAKFLISKGYSTEISHHNTMLYAYRK